MSTSKFYASKSSWEQVLDSLKPFSGRLTLRNDYHATQAVVVVKNGIVSSDSLRRAEKKLCGRLGCYCGRIVGEQDLTVERRCGRDNKDYLFVTGDNGEQVS